MCGNAEVVSSFFLGNRFVRLANFTIAYNGEAFRGIAENFVANN
jgi:hypothetical protein